MAAHPAAHLWDLFVLDSHRADRIWHIKLTAFAVIIPSFLSQLSAYAQMIERHALDDSFCGQDEIWILLSIQSLL